MKSGTLIVVGDKFEEFAQAEQTITLSQLESIIKIPSKVFSKKNNFVVGLGCRLDLYEQVINSVEAANTDHNFSLDALRKHHQNYFLANKNTHQKSEHNVLIGQAEKLDDNLYSLPFMIDERCTLMADHQTGRHVQGVLITEAFRQSFIAIAEEFYSPNKEINKYFVINEMNISFINFVFPLPATIYFELLNIDSNEFRTKLKARISLKQNNVLCATMESQFIVYPSEYISKKEAKLAEEVLSLYITNLQETEVVNHV
ncbi:AfsA-related hotdog domain-containing protein [Orbus sturtevantii]|uniref:AfsA-related hotdog domain-containing protein n=1 Tax=Orbus sturtevantii TaxID=3074109 RepID=UPI00370D73CE